MIWIDDENEAVNWLWYCTPAYRDEDCLPPARRHSGAWQEQLWGARGATLPGFVSARSLPGR
jgi:hypothetical protein